jgi:hypothetical protein
MQDDHRVYVWSSRSERRNRPRGPGTTKLHRLEEELEAADVELSFSDLHEIADAVSRVDVQDARYPERMQKLVER